MKQCEKRQRYVEVHGGIIFKCKVHMLCVIVGDEHWRVGCGYDLTDFTAILRNFILDNWEALEILKRKVLEGCIGCGLAWHWAN